MSLLCIQGDEYTFNTLIKIFSYSGDAPRALQVHMLKYTANTSSTI